MPAESQSTDGSQGLSAATPGPSAGLIARAAAHAELPEVRSASRLGFVGVWLRRLVRRLTRFQSLPQFEYNRAVLDALRTQEAALGALSAQLRGLSQSLEAVVERSIPLLGSQIGGLSQSLEAVVERSIPSLGNQLGLVAKTVQELSEGFSDTYNTLHAQGRHLDALASQVGDFGDAIERARKDTDAFEERLQSDAAGLREAMSDLMTRWRPNLHFDHFDFSRKHRGSEDELVRRMAKYAVLFGPVQRVLDVGCGRGEFLEACREAGVGAYGIETDPDMVSRCRMKALEVHESDVLEHLRGLEDRSLDGLFMAQVIEHLTAAEIVDFIRVAAAKLRRGATVIIETINPDTFSALRWFWIDPTHRQPVSPAMLRFLLDDAGFTLRDVLFSSPVPEEEALQRLPEGATAVAGGDREAVRAYNQNVEKLNRILFGEQDYAIIAER